MPTKTSVKRPRAKQLGPKLRRPLVLDAALPLFVEHGYNETSMDSVAEAAGVAKPVLYDCFPNKRALYEALVDREEKCIRGQIRDAFPDNPDLNDIDQLLTDSFTASFKAVAANPMSWRAAFASERGTSPEIARRVQQVRQNQIDLIAHIAKQFLSKHGLPDSDRMGTLLAHVISAAGDAAAKLMLERPETWAPEELGRILGRIIVHGSNDLLKE